MTECQAPCRLKSTLGSTLYHYIHHLPASASPIDQMHMATPASVAPRLHRAPPRGGAFPVLGPQQPEALGPAPSCAQCPQTEEPEPGPCPDLLPVL